MRIRDLSSDVCSSDLLRWSYDPDGCCEIRKVKPLEKALTDFDTSITGRKGFQSSTRQGLARFELDGSTGRLKFNPLANWTREQLDAYFRSEEQTSELQSIMRLPYAVFCLKKKNTK